VESFSKDKRQQASTDATLIRNALNNAGLTIKTGSEIGCEMVCIGKGVHPNVDFIEPAGIRVDRGVVVDRYTRCSAADVYAAGDVAPIKVHIIDHMLHYGHFLRH
jgi:NAD(P)H-nitrite reductase large subunit